MAMMRISERLIRNDEPEDAFCDHQQANDYKGIFYGDNSEKKYFEGGAHFSYRDLYKRLFDLTKKLSPSRIGMDRSDTTDKSEGFNESSRESKLKSPKLNENYHKEKKKLSNFNSHHINNQNVFNKASNSSRNTNQNSAKIKNMKTIQVINNNNNINLSNLNVNVNVNVSNFNNINSSRNKQGKNDDLVDKITIIKQSVEKYSEEAKKKIESQLLKSTLNNDNIIDTITKTLNHNGISSNVIDYNNPNDLLMEKDKISYKKVPHTSLKPVGHKKEVVKIQNVVVNKNRLNSSKKIIYRDGSEINPEEMTSIKKSHQNHNISQPIFAKEKLNANFNSKSNINNENKKLDGMIKKINNFLLNSNQVRSEKTKCDVKIRHENKISKNLASDKYNSFIIKNSKDILDKTTNFNNLNQLSSRQPNKINPIPTNKLNINIKSRNNKDLLNSNSMPYNSDRTHSRKTNKLVLVTAQRKSNFEENSSHSKNKNKLNMDSYRENIKHSVSKERLFLLGNIPSITTQKYRALQSKISFVKDNVIKSNIDMKPPSSDRNYKLA